MSRESNELRHEASKLADKILNNSCQCQDGSIAIIGMTIEDVGFIRAALELMAGNIYEDNGQ